MVRHLRGDHRAPAPDRRRRALPVVRQDRHDRLRAHGRHAGAPGRERPRAGGDGRAGRAAQGHHGDAGRQSCSLLAGGVGRDHLEGGGAGGPATTVRGVVTFLAPEPGDPTDRVVNLHDPRLQIIADRIQRGEILDRNGERSRARTRRRASATYPLGDAMGTLLGPAEAIVLRPEWMIERQLDGKLRGYRDLTDGPAVWLAEKPDGGERLLFVVQAARAQAGGPRAGGQDGGGRRGPAARPRRPRLPAPAAAACARAGTSCEKVVDDVPSRTARITIDARLQTPGLRHPQGGGEEGQGRGRRRARRRHRPGAGARAVAGLRPGQREVHAAPDRSRLPTEGQEVHGRLRPLAGQDRHPRRLPGRLGGEGLHLAGRGARGPARHRHAARGQDRARLPLQAPRRAGPLLHAARLVQGHPRPPRRPDARRRRVHPRPGRELQRLLRPARPGAGAGAFITSSTTGSRSGGTAR